MPRYRFHLYNGEDTMDLVGRIFPDRDAAQSDAVQNARAIMAADLTEKGEITLSHRIEVENDEGEIVVLPFGDAVIIHP